MSGQISYRLSGRKIARLVMVLSASALLDQVGTFLVVRGPNPVGTELNPYLTSYGDQWFCVSVALQIAFIAVVWGALWSSARCAQSAVDKAVENDLLRNGFYAPEVRIELWPSINVKPADEMSLTVFCSLVYLTVFFAIAEFLLGLNNMSAFLFTTDFVSLLSNWIEIRSVEDAWLSILVATVVVAGAFTPLFGHAALKGLIVQHRSD